MEERRKRFGSQKLKGGGELARKELVVHLLTSLGFGGIERRMKIIAEHAIPGRKLVFIALGAGGDAEAAIVAAGHEVRCLGERTSVYSLKTMLAVYRLLRELRPQVLHAHGVEANFHGLIAGFLAGVPARVGEEVGIPNHSKKAWIVLRVAYSFAHRVVAISPVVARFLASSREVSRRKVHLVENPIQGLKVTAVPFTRTPGLPLCVYVGRLVDWKNVHSILDALYALSEQGRPFELLLVGDGPLREALLKHAIDLNISQYVHFVGFQQQPQDYVALSDLFILASSEREGYCLALVEAMAIGVPAVSTKVGIAPEVIQHGENGWLVPWGDAQALVLAIDEALSLPSLSLKEIGHEAQRRVLSRNSPDRYLAQLDLLYDQLRPDKQGF